MDFDDVLQSLILCSFFVLHCLLSVLWDLEPEEVEDILKELVNKSLLFVDI